ncbi:uncharacterized protein LOC111319342 [Stylophora pistillata]|nr:uncharacterized protein LOC111319342 [Stylophora pistillata]
MQRDWVPIKNPVSIGKLPETVTEEPIVLSLDKAVPNGAEEVLIYTFITSKGEGDFQRYYYNIYTSQDGRDYSQYMNIATGQDMNVINSANLWFPIKTSDRNLRVILVPAYDPNGAKKSKIKHIAGKLQEREDWSDVFVIGYR